MDMSNCDHLGMLTIPWPIKFFKTFHIEILTSKNLYKVGVRWPSPLWRRKVIVKVGTHRDKWGVQRLHPSISSERGYDFELSIVLRR